ncbi:hypothetical protein QVD17_00377 [Tagetes erecta]|uniref:Uncharacterized protein n=1 Tax=Tagetes erecta TaxID=13708 RepID=A0AAD8P5T4_TARER|nr:hypothetical protein QVD17_00377 [Tagetes erecta]
MTTKNKPSKRGVHFTSPNCIWKMSVVCGLHLQTYTKEEVNQTSAVCKKNYVFLVVLDGGGKWVVAVNGGGGGGGGRLWLVGGSGSGRWGLVDSG